MGPQAPMGHRGGGEEGEERLRAGRIQARRRRGEERCGDRDARQPRKYSAGKQRAGAGEGRGGGAEMVPEPRKRRAQVAGRQETGKGGAEAEGGRRGDRKLGRLGEIGEAGRGRGTGGRRGRGRGPR